MDDLISRQMAINEIKEYITDPNQAISEYEDNVFYYNSGLKSAVQAVVDLPSVQSEYNTEFIKLTVRESNGKPYYSIVYLKVDDNGVEHDFEGYSSYSLDVISDYLKEYFMPSAQRWIPCSERLPEERDWYLGIFKEPDTGWINPLPFICDYLLGTKTKATTKGGWILKGFTDREEYIDYYFNLECVAWMPLPEPYRKVGESSEEG